jgi:serine/threonine-protein kinase
MAMALEAGDLVDQKYRIVRFIGRGAWASVYEGVNSRIGRRVAIKVLSDEAIQKPGIVERFEREAQAATRIDSPHVVHVFDLGVLADGRPYIVMELLEGQTLERLMHQIRPLPENDALAIVSQILEGLDYLHSQGVIHRDLKPQNIMLCSDGSLRIMDFGIAKVAASRRMTFGGFSPTMGTPDYMAPEQVKGQRGDERTDIYSVGAILYEMLTGRVPFEGQNAYMIMNARLLGDPVAPRTHNPSIRPQVEEVVLHAMARDPSHRYPSVAEMKAEVDAPDLVTVTGRADRLQAPKPWKSRWRNARIVAISVLVPIILFYLFFLMFSHR